jgi:hypothetical protein
MTTEIALALNEVTDWYYKPLPGGDGGSVG